MSWQEIGSGTTLTELPDHEDLVPEGSRGLVRIKLRYMPPDSVLDDIRYSLSVAGVAEASVTDEGNDTLAIGFRKGMPWLAVIALALVVLAILVISWQLFKEVGPIASTGIVLLLIMLAAIAGLLIWNNMRKG